MPTTAIVDLREHGFVSAGVATYAHDYEHYMGILTMLATSREPYTVIGAPRCWSPLIEYFGHTSRHEAEVWPCDATNWRAVVASFAPDTRHGLEVACACRPELVDALFKADVELPGTRRRVSLPADHSFVVTTNSGMFRPEFMEYERMLIAHAADVQPWQVIVPCAADKPYPAELHRRVKAICGDDFTLVVATGVLGVIPESLFTFAPNYDAGLPHMDRVEKACELWFSRTRPTVVVSYSDFCGPWIRRGFDAAGVAGCMFYPVFEGTVGYQPLLSPFNLRRLACVVARVHNLIRECVR